MRVVIDYSDGSHSLRNFNDTEGIERYEAPDTADWEALAVWLPKPFVRMYREHVQQGQIIEKMLSLADNEQDHWREQLERAEAAKAARELPLKQAAVLSMVDRFSECLCGSGHCGRCLCCRED